MAFQVEKGVFTANTTTGDQVVDLEDESLTPKAVILWAEYATAEGITNGSGIFSFGMGTRRGGATQQGYVSLFDLDAVGTSQTVHDLNTDAVFKAITSDAVDATATDAEATLVSFAAGEFTINWSNAPASAIRIHFMVFGGDDITDVVVTQPNISIGVATQDVTVVSGFGQPDLVLLATHSYNDNFSQSDARFGFGAFKSDTERQCMVITYEDAAAAMSISNVYGDAGMICFGGGTTIDCIADISARANWPTDGWEFQYDTQSGFAFKLLALSFKGDFTATIGADALLTAGSTQDLALASGTPKGILVMGSEVNLTNRTPDTTAADLGGHYFGGSDGTREGLAGMVNDDGNTSSRASRFHSESKTVARHIADAGGAAATLDAEADGSVSGSNFRLTYNNLAAVAADFVYVIFGEEAVIGGASSVRGGGASAGVGAKGGSGVSTARGGGTLAAQSAAQRFGSSAVAGGGLVASVGEVGGAPAFSGTSAVRGGGTAASAVAKTAAGSSSVGGGGSVASAVSKGGTGTSTVRGGGTGVSAGFEGGLGGTGVSGGGGVTSAGQKAATGTSAVRGGGSVSGTGTSAESHSGASAVRGGGLAASAGTKTGQSVSSARSGGSIAASATKSVGGTSAVRGGGSVVSTGVGQTNITGTSSVRGGGFLTLTATGTHASASVVRGGGFVTSTAVAGQPAAPAVTTRTRAGPASGRTMTSGATGRTLAGATTGRTSTMLDEEA